MGRNSLTQVDLQAVLSYDPDTGLFTNLKNNRVVGWQQSGYLKYEVFGKKYYLHRLVWLYAYGHTPDCEIDHINRNRSDNRLCNLREASRHENLWNSPVRCDSSLGLKGVEYVKKINKYRAVITLYGIKHRLGTFLTAEEASQAYNQKAKQFHKEFYYER